jgi:glycosyltransferase involved in cell wall biosynthesis
MAEAPSISVLLPVRDACETLQACLASLRAQTLADHEVVAVDDGSSDGSGALLEAAARDDDRLRVVRTPALGLAAALNTALDRARAALVARMDADDVAHPERLGRQAARLRADRETAILGCRVRLSGGEGRSAGMQRYVAWQNALLDHDAIVRDLWVESPLVHLTCGGSTATARSTAPRTTTSGCALTPAGCASPSSPRRFSTGAIRRSA